MSKTYAIIVGTNKGASTSVFNYLADHPDVCGSYIKQTNFFLGPSPGKEVAFDVRDGFDQYDKFFTDCSPTSKILLEASPDYMYSTIAAERMQQYLGDKDHKLIFLLRHPVSRFLSWYGFAKQTKLIPESMSVADYLKANQVENTANNPAYDVLETGRYSKYIEHYLRMFSSGNLLFLYYEDLKQDSKGFLKELSAALTLDPGFYDDYSFRRFNPTVKVRSHRLRQAYMLLRKMAKQTVYDQEWFRKLFSRPIGYIQRTYKTVNSVAPSHELDHKSEQFLQDYYFSEIQLLPKMIGKSTPW